MNTIFEDFFNKLVKVNQIEYKPFLLLYYGHVYGADVFSIPSTVHLVAMKTEFIFSLNQANP